VIHYFLKNKALQVEVDALRLENEELRKRLEGCGPVHYGAICEYADSLVVEGVPRFGTLAKLEWMLRMVVGHSRRQQIVIDKLRGSG
jgi:hypothetical protein